MSFATVQSATGAESIEVPVTQETNLISLSTLRSQFPGAIGLKFKNPDTGAFRAVNIEDGQLHCPEHLLDWGATTFTVVIEESAKRSADDEEHPTKRPNVTNSGDTKSDGAGDNADGNDDDDARAPRSPPPTSSSSYPDTKGGDDSDRDPIQQPGGKECYNCNGTGHIAAICPSPSGARHQASDFKCRMCGGQGHVQARCPSGGARNLCYTCGMPGHRARECYAQRSGYGYGRGGNDYYRPRPGPHERSCYTCGEFGHIAASCPRGATGERICHICQQPGHIARECNRCKICKREGHRSYDCPERSQRPPSSSYYGSPSNGYGNAYGSSYPPPGRQGSGYDGASHHQSSSYASAPRDSAPPSNYSNSGYYGTGSY